MNMKLIITLVSVACVGLIATGAYYATRPKTAPPRIVPLSQAYNDRVKEGGWVMGSASPKVKLVEYGDFQCPACDALAPNLKAAMAQVGDTVQLEFRVYPLPQHANAVLAATAAEAAGRQGKYWEMHDELYDTQTQWENLSSVDFRGFLIDAADKLGLNKTQFTNDIDDVDGSIASLIAKSKDAGNAINLEATPTLVVNGKTVDQSTTGKLVTGTSDDVVAFLKSAASN